MIMDITENRFAMEQVKDLEVAADAARLTFLEAADNEIRVTAEKLKDGEYTCELRGSRLTVSYRLHGTRVIRGPRQEKTQIIVYLPVGSSFDTVEIEIGACELRMDAVSVCCRCMHVEVGAGEWNAGRILVSDKLDIEVGAGKIKLDEAKVGDLNISCGAGVCIFAGRVGRDINISCGVGSCELWLENEERDFQYDISCALGKVIVNDSKVMCIGTQRHSKEKGALGIATLDCSVGKIEVRTR